MPCFCLHQYPEQYIERLKTPVEWKDSKTVARAASKCTGSRAAAAPAGTRAAPSQSQPRASLMETGSSPWEGRPYYSMATIRPIPDIKHLINT